MVRKTIIAILMTTAAIGSAYGDLRFSIRYQDKNIYYPGDDVRLKLTLANPDMDGTGEETFYLADDPRRSFGFDLRSLTGEPVEDAGGFVAALNRGGSYRIVHLAPGQELSLTVSLSGWTDITMPGQYRLAGFFYPALRSGGEMANLSESVLDLTIMPPSERRWEDELDRDIREALLHRGLSPRQVVEETLDSRGLSRFNRAVLYMDVSSLARTMGMTVEMLDKTLSDGAWENLPGFDHPALKHRFISSQAGPSEATVRMEVTYSPYGESFQRDLRFYLHNPDGYWTIRRIESLAPGDVDPAVYGTLDLAPPEIVSEMLQAAKRGDWEIFLRYYDVETLVKESPEYVESWRQMSYAEHMRATDDYRSQLLAGGMDDGRTPLSDIEDWMITRVSYTDSEGSVTVRNTRTHTTAAGTLEQTTLYTFRLERLPMPNRRWIVRRYDTVIVRE